MTSPATTASPCSSRHRHRRPGRVRRSGRSVPRSNAVAGNATSNVARDEIQDALRAEQLQAPGPVVDAFAATTTAAVGIIGELNRQITKLEQSLTDHFEQHPDADIYRSLPGLGVVLGARALGEFGDDPNRYADSKSRKNYAGTSPRTDRVGQETSRARPPRPQPAPLRRTIMGMGRRSSARDEHTRPAREIGAHERLGVAERRARARSSRRPDAARARTRATRPARSQSRRVREQVLERLGSGGSRHQRAARLVVGDLVGEVVHLVLRRRTAGSTR